MERCLDARFQWSKISRNWSKIDFKLHNSIEFTSTKDENWNFWTELVRLWSDFVTQFNSVHDAFNSVLKFEVSFSVEVT